MSTDKDTINAYNQHAKKHKTYALKSTSGHTMLEKPAIMNMVKENIAGKSVLCVGCGSGDEGATLLDLGASEVVGIDISQELIDCARDTYPAISFHHMDMVDIESLGKKFDIIYSSLAIHYVKDRTGVLKTMKKCLHTGGEICFSTHHPVKRGAQSLRTDESKKSLMGYETIHGTTTLFGDYLTERKIQSSLVGKLLVTYYHKPISKIFQHIQESGLQLIELQEPAPIDVCKDEDPEFYNIYSKIPLFLIIKLKNI